MATNKMLLETDPNVLMARQTLSMNSLMAATQQFGKSAVDAATAHLHLPATAFAYHHPAHYDGTALANLHAGGSSGLYHTTRDQATFSHA